MNISNSMIDQLVALDQAESHFRSENIKFGIRHRMRSGKTVLNHTQFLGYTKGPDGILQIVPEEAEVVRKIFELYIRGNGVRRIKRYLEENGIKTVTGKAEWNTSTIGRKTFELVQRMKGSAKVKKENRQAVCPSSNMKFG